MPSPPLPCWQRCASTPGNCLPARANWRMLDTRTPTIFTCWQNVLTHSCAVVVNGRGASDWSANSITSMQRFNGCSTTWGGVHKDGLRMAGALSWFWLMRGYHAERLLWLDKVLPRTPPVGPAYPAKVAARTQALLGLGPLLAERKDTALAKAKLEETLLLARQQGPASAALARAISQQGGRAVISGDWGKSIQLLQEVLRRWEEIGDPHAIGMTLFVLGTVSFAQRSEAEAVAIEMRALEQFETAGDRHMAARVRFTLAAIERGRGNLLGAARHLHAGLHVARSAGTAHSSVWARGRRCRLPAWPAVGSTQSRPHGCWVRQMP